VSVYYDAQMQRWSTDRMLLQFNAPDSLYDSMHMSRSADGSVAFSIRYDTGILSYQGEMSAQGLNGVVTLRSGPEGGMLELENGCVSGIHFEEESRMEGVAQEVEAFRSMLAQHPQVMTQLRAMERELQRHSGGDAQNITGVLTQPVSLCR
jgi:hypothetical protein